ncbi:hypothetical protein RA210_U680002 [Rubrivivax sp. A210]|nr:hypothetical protein RA210_U680002 [Rubrivivax sp. A210]
MSESSPSTWFSHSVFWLIKHTHIVWNN